MNGEEPSGLGIAERAVAMALDVGATQAEARVIRTRSALTRIANNQVHAAATARLQPEQSDFRSLPAAHPTPLVAGAFASATAEADPEVRAEAAAAVIAAAEAVGAQAFGYAQTGSEEVSVANSLGIRVSEPRSRAQVLTVMMGPGGGTGYAEQVAVDLGTIDASAIGHEAAARTAAMREPIELPAGDYPVVLDSYAVMDFTDWLGYLGCWSASAMTLLTPPARRPPSTTRVWPRSRWPSWRPASAATSCTTLVPRRGPAANRRDTGCPPPIPGDPSRCT